MKPLGIALASLAVALTGGCVHRNGEPTDLESAQAVAPTSPEELFAIMRTAAAKRDGHALVRLALTKEAVCEKRPTLNPEKFEERLERAHRELVDDLTDCALAFDWGRAMLVDVTHGEVETRDACDGRLTTYSRTTAVFVNPRERHTVSLRLAGFDGRLWVSKAICTDWRRSLISDTDPARVPRELTPSCVEYRDTMNACAAAADPFGAEALRRETRRVVGHVEYLEDDAQNAICARLAATSSERCTAARSVARPVGDAFAAPVKTVPALFEAMRQALAARDLEAYHQVLAPDGGLACDAKAKPIDRARADRAFVSCALDFDWSRASFYAADDGAKETPVPGCGPNVARIGKVLAVAADESRSMGLELRVVRVDGQLVLASPLECEDVSAMASCDGLWACSATANAPEEAVPECKAYVTHVRARAENLDPVAARSMTLRAEQAMMWIAGMPPAIQARVCRDMPR